MTEEKQVTFLIPQAGESTGYIRVSSGLGQNPDGVVYKNEVEFRTVHQREAERIKMGLPPRIQFLDEPRSGKKSTGKKTRATRAT
jgi:hypothetical protein